MQRALIQYRDPKLRGLVEEALVKAGRQDLIGMGEKCLIRPEGMRRRDLDGGDKARRDKAGKGEMQKGESWKRGKGTGELQTGEKKRKKRTIRNVHKRKG